MSDYFEYTIPTSTNYWTNDDEDIPTEFFNRIEWELKDFVNKNYPQINFSTRLVVENMSYNNRNLSSMTDEDEQELAESIDHWMSTRWPDWLAESYE